MKKKTYTILTLILSLLCMNRTYAACTQEEIKEFKRIEDEYKVTYKFNKNTKDYNITIYNPYPDSYAYSFDESLNSIKYESGDAEKMTFSGIRPGSYKIKIIKINGCIDGLYTINLKLDGYNKYSEDPICEGIEEFVLCQPTYGKEIDYETFVSRVETYKKTKKTEYTDNNEEPEQQNEIIKYIEENILSIIIVVVFIILLTITAIITAKSIRKSRRLE